MKITSIEISNVMAIKEVNLKPDAPIVLFCGRNGSGKSSIYDTVALALSQPGTTKKANEYQLRGVTMKNEFGLLVHDGEKAGGAQIIMDGDLDQTFAFNMPKGDFTGPEITEAMRVAVHGQRFARMDEDQRRTFLFGLAKVKPTTANVRERLVKAGCDEKKIDQILPMMRTGFPSVSKEAAAKATEAKGAWRQVTAQAAYGSKLAADWVAPEPELPAGDQVAMKAALDNLDTQIATLTEQLGQMKQAAAQAEKDATDRAALAVKAGRVDELTKLVADKNAERDAFQKKVEALRERAKGRARVGLVHDMATFINGLRASITTPEAATRQAELLLAYAKEYGDIDKAVTPDPEAVTSLPEHENGLKVLTNAASNLARDLTEAQVAKGQFDKLAPPADAKDTAAEIAELPGLIDEAREARQALANELMDIEAVLKKRAEAADKTKTAAGHHATVEAWTAIANQLAPDGIPAQLLKEALAPINGQLKQAAIDSGWPVVKICDDMAITMGGRLYQLMSESFQWRADAMIAHTVALLSGLKIIQLDRVDVLDGPSRDQLLEWLDLLVANKELDSALLYATLKSPPVGLFDTIAVHWVDRGTIVNVAQQQAA